MNHPTRQSCREFPPRHSARSIRMLSHNSRKKNRVAGFTLVELLVVITIIAILAGTLLGALYTSQEAARRRRTEALIRKLHGQMAIRWESYQTRRLPIDPTVKTAPDGTYSGTPGAFPDFIEDNFATPGSPTYSEEIAARLLLARYELMQMELPDHYKDLDPDAGAEPEFLRVPTAMAGVTDPVYPAIWKSYTRRIARVLNKTSLVYTDYAGIQAQNQSAELLYLILTTNLGSDGGAVFSERDTGDTDEDGMPEFVDAWGNPIEWIRWPAGFISDLQPAAVDKLAPTPTVTRSVLSHPNPFDVQRIDPPPTAFDLVEPRGYALFPLIVSSGPDDEFGLAFRWNPEATNRSDPYELHDPPAPDTPPSPNYDDSPRQRGETLQFRRETSDPRELYLNDLSGDTGYNGYELDNIHNHQLNN